MRLAVEQVEFSYGWNRTIWPHGRAAITAISFAMPGGIVGIVGPNGSGKTTLLRIIATRLSPLRGTVRYDGLLAQGGTLPSIRARIGYVPQDDHIPDRMGVAGFLDYVALHKGLRRAVDRRWHIDAALAQCALANCRDRHVADLSGGARRRLLIAQALLGDPELLVLDEPFTNLDPVQRMEMSVMLFTAHPGRTVLCSTHQVADIAAYCDHLAVLDHGTLLAFDTPASLRQRSTTIPALVHLASIGRATLHPTGGNIMEIPAPAEPASESTPSTPSNRRPSDADAVVPGHLPAHPQALTIQIDRVNKSYRGHPNVLRDISLTIPPGIFGLLGSNGAGKTTLLQIIATLLVPDQGSVHIGPYSTLHDRWEIRRRLGYLPQEHGWYPQLSVRETLRYFAVLQGIDQIEAAVNEVLHAVNLTSEARRHVNQLSGGMRRRLGLAQALLGNPPLLIVDEPTAGLDPIEQQRFRTLLATIGARGDRTILLSTHIIEDIAASAARVAVLDAGRLAFNGTTNVLVEQAAGQAWTWMASAAEVERRRAAGAFVLVGLAPHPTLPDQMIATIVGPRPDTTATPRLPTLTDGYLALIGKEYHDVPFTH